ncbi:MAG: hypothetical protein K2H61_09235 [Muribaculaceae bacterium]|nr:hypothetical protein [Muribaculaceae bacterium]
MNQSRNSRYRLGRQAIHCPQCGRPTFKPYVDVAGNMLHPTVGRCNRENNCAYFLNPSQFFQANPDFEAPAVDPSTIPRAATRNRSYINAAVATTTICRPRFGNFYAYFVGLFGTDTVDRVFNHYFVGQSKLWGGSPIFWLYDAHMRVRSGKIMAYDADCHRIKEPRPLIRWVHKLMPDADRFVMEMTWFGMPAARLFPEAEIIVVESEKTALYLACRLWQWGAFGRRYVPVATLGLGNLGLAAADKSLLWYAVGGRRLLLLPDADGVDKWMEKARQHIAPHARRATVADIRRYGARASDDIMDLLLRRHRHYTSGRRFEAQCKVDDPASKSV